MVTEITDKAKKILKNNNECYGNPIQTLNDIAQIASILTRKELTAVDCVIVLKVLKQVRESRKHNEDNLIDLIGYTEIEEMLKGGANEL